MSSTIGFCLHTIPLLDEMRQRFDNKKQMVIMTIRPLLSLEENARKREKRTEIRKSTQI